MTTTYTTEQQLEALDKYIDAKQNLKEVGFFLYTDIEVNKETKWSYDGSQLEFGLIENNDYDRYDDFEFQENARVRQKNNLFTVFSIYECTGSEYVLVLLNKNEV